MVDREKVKALRQALAEGAGAPARPGASAAPAGGTKKRFGCVPIGCGVLFVVMVVIPMMIGFVSALLPEADAPDPAAATQAPPPQAAWRYETAVDPATGETVRTACVRADPPAAAPGADADAAAADATPAADLCLTRLADGAVTAALTLPPPGRLACAPRADCRVRVRFDGGEAQAFALARRRGQPAGEAAFADPAALEAGLARADAATVQLPGEGEADGPILTFDTWNLAWPDPAAKPDKP